MDLLILNYSMHSDSLVFSHQRKVVSALSKHFERVTVLTSEYDLKSPGLNVNVMVQNWERGRAVKNAFRILVVLIPFLTRNRNIVVFSHMTDVQCALISPLTRLLRIRHVLWYAHSHNSVYLNWSSFFVSSIVSSTPGSCNLRLNRGKLRFINQGISQEDFPYHSKRFVNLTRIFNYGRLDVSKNIHLFLDLLLALNQDKKVFSVDVYGNSSSGHSIEYLEGLKHLSKRPEFQSTFNIHPGLNRKNISSESEKYELFLNLFVGSLDKTLIEATMLGLPVLTWNREYCEQFGTWSGNDVKESLDFILEELSFIRSMQEQKLRREILRRYHYAIEMHAFDGWINRLLFVLNGGVK